MAVTKCKECGGQVSSKAEKCPHCGVKVPKSSGVWLLLLGGFALLVVIGAFSGESPSRSTQQPLATPQGVTAQPAAARVVPEDLSLWKYSESEDAATGKKVRNASLDSLNFHEFAFPYTGRTHASLHIRKHPRYGNDVILEIDRGQLICQIDGCTVLIRIDDSPPLRVAATEPADHSRTALFLQGYAGLVSKLRKSKKAVVTATVYQEGEPSWEFRTANLKWD